MQAGQVTTATCVARVSPLTILGHMTLSQVSKAEPIFMDECLFIFNTLSYESGTLCDAMSFTFTDRTR